MKCEPQLQEQHAIEILLKSIHGPVGFLLKGFTIKTFEKLLSKVGNLQEEAKQLRVFEKTGKLEPSKTSTKKFRTTFVVRIARAIEDILITIVLLLLSKEILVISMDLSGNQFIGSIPESLGSSNLQLVLLNDNELEGQVPEKLYSVGVHGGVIDLSGNNGLCGVPSLPPCPFFWDKKKLSTRGKIAIALSCGVFMSIVLLVYVACIKRGRNDYEFGPPQDLLSSAMASKRNKYQRQKMLLEMETQHSDGFVPRPNPH
ncbi:uncharacterized protein LOC110018618 [Phalaenopsis equestris]|uniref:uncharacterized protein LOC110018618 n=1 Tax=Phalaenopsis equestris TaxID=78828 RepID=UPI0009E3E6B6|nr:uncharacterized protein LOC110018618 [Phalaenopsis equestris]